MKHWRVWSIYGLLMAMALLAMALITRSSLVMERAQRASLLNALRARLEIANQQQIVVAARAIDRELVSLVVSESLRSHLDYQQLPAGDWQFNRFVNAYFHVDGRGIIKARTIKTVDPDKLRSLLNSLRWREDVPSPLTGRQASWLTRPDEMYRVNALVNRPRRPSEATYPFPDQAPKTSRPFAAPPVGDLGLANLIPEKYPQTTSPVSRNPALPRGTSVSIGPIYSIWINQELLFVRRVVIEDQEESRDFLQGCWLEWSLLSSQLLRTVQTGLPPESRLEPVVQQPGVFSGEYVGWVPLRVVTPELFLPTDGMPLQGGWLNLLLGWVFMSIAGLAIGMLLQTVLREARRRETFVSAVTHELRTPLTAFRLYTDLLAKNPDPEKTRLYAKTLESEAERLSHLVENVLTYSRLERRGITSHHRVVTAGTLLDAIVPRLDEHCVRNQMLLDYSDATREIRQREILTDPSAVERILFNLVDNACKYGKSAEEAMIQLEVFSDQKMLSIKVRDFGPGINPAQKRRLFQAYNHGQISAQTPNKTIGLGLNISLQLATALGGKLTFREAEPGAEFQLDLPWQAPR
ncbi:MAG: HAMP domain-containing histidine kinase [Planctomycetaceae bacterium]|nr:HAMP domain-containing histidine kinase [Planctomycetaceae bacterium]